MVRSQPHVPSDDLQKTHKRPWWRDELALDDCPYIVRYVLDLGPLGSLRVHHWLADDDQRAHHDHPWGFLTLVLWGGYDDVSYAWEQWKSNAPRLPEIVDHLRAGSIRWRSAEHAHTVRTKGAWTLLWTQPKQRSFGFFVERGGLVKWMKANKYFLTYRHPPCS